MEKIPTWLWFLWFSIAIYTIYSKLKEQKIKKEELEKSLKKEQELKTQKASEIQNNIEKADSIKIKLSEIQKLKIINVSDYKEVIIDNEKIIIDKGGNELLFNLLKIDTFLKEYRDSIVNDKKFLTEDSGKIRDDLFESNIRHFQGSVDVNKKIKTAVETVNDRDFWWLNNGITIIAEGDEGSKINNKPIALHGHRCGCGCSLITSLPCAGKR
jgi:hypothetical protein